MARSLNLYQNICAFWEAGRGHELPFSAFTPLFVWFLKQITKSFGS